MTEPHGVTMIERDDGLEVRTRPPVRTYQIRTADGHVLGDLYGVILRGWPSDRVRVTDAAIEVSAPVTDIETFESTVLDEIRGSYVARTHSTLPPRLYPDPGLTLPVVFSAESRRLGSSASMILDEDEYRERFVAERYERLIEREGYGSWIPGRLTAHRGVERLLANHYLDLTTWTARRFWPRPQGFDLDVSPDDAVEIVATNLSQFMKTVAPEFRTGITLTAGFDSRMLVAAAREVVDEVEFFTITPPKHGLDQIMAGTIADGLGLRHRFVPIVEAAPAEQEAWDRATGHSVREVNRVNHPTLRTIDYDVILTGLYGEPGRTFLYVRDFEEINTKPPVSTDSLVSRLALPNDPEVRDEVAVWLDRAPDLPNSTILDLAYLELRLSSWGGAQVPANFAEQMELTPFNQRTIQEAFLRVPAEQKGDAALFHRAIPLMWPAAAEFPINSFGDYRDHLFRASKLLQRGPVIRALRKRMR